MKRRRRTKKSVTIVSESPKKESLTRPFNVADDLALSSSDDDDSSDDYFVDVTVEELTDKPTATKPTRPLPVATAPRCIGGIYAAVVARPAGPTALAAKRRQLEMASDVRLPVLVFVGSVKTTALQFQFGYGYCSGYTFVIQCFC